MKKLLIISGILFFISLLFISSAFVVSGFDVFEMTNYNNYTKNEEYFDNVTSLDISDCEIIQIDKHSKNNILVVYYTNDKSNYDIKNINNSLQIEGDIKSQKSFGMFNPKGIEIYLPSNTEFNININSENCVLDIENIIANNITINNEDGVINIEDVRCNSLTVSLDSGVVNVDDVYSPVIDITTNNGVLSVELPFERYKYTLDISGNSFCNVSSGGTGEYLIKIKNNKGITNVKFD